MTLTETLRIEERYLQFEDLRAMAYCERRWQEDGRPATRWGMFSFIERMLRELQQTGVGYPKVLLLRKKEIQRGTFALEPREERNGPKELQTENGHLCPDCEGRGFLLLPGGNGTLCMSCLGRGRSNG